MDRNCKLCKNYFKCEASKLILIPEVGCNEFISAKKHDYVMIHKRLDSGFYSIVTFGNDFSSLIQMEYNLPEFGKKNNDFYVVSNQSGSRVTEIVNEIKDGCLLNICENVAYVLSRAEYSMLKKKYSRSKSCFDRAKSMIADACNILDNY